MSLRSEIGIASALGALIGLVFGWVMDGNLFLSVIIGIPAAFLCYKPTEVGSTISAIISDVVGVLWGGAWVTGIWGHVKRGTYAVCIASTALVSLAIIPTMVVLSLLFVGVSMDGGQVIGVYAVALVPTIFGIPALLGMDTMQSRHWSFPILRHVVARIPLWFRRTSLGKLVNKNANPPTRWEDMLVAALLPIMLGVAGSFLIVMVFPDIVVTTFLALASSERLAAVVGATVGCIAGAVSAYTVAMEPLLVLPVGSGVGYLTGSVVYAIREYLANLPVPVLAKS